MFGTRIFIVGSKPRNDGGSAVISQSFGRECNYLSVIWLGISVCVAQSS